MTNRLPKPIADVSEIDIDSHTVIEASAGTGKTYTIERLVLRLLKEKKVSNLDEILIVTFTEKAASELRHRIRGLLQDEFQAAPCITIKQAIESFESASIYTIHGFCNRILRDFAFESFSHFTCSLTDERSLIKEILSGIITEDWPKTYGDHLALLISISGFPDAKGRNTSLWIKKCIDLTEKYRPAAGDVLIPSPGTDVSAAVSSINQNIADACNKLQRLMPYHEDIDQNSLYLAYMSLNINKKKLSAKLKVLSLLIRLIACYRNKSLTIPYFIEWKKQIFEFCSTFDFLNDSWNKSGQDFMLKLPELLQIISIANELLMIDSEKLEHILMSDTAVLIKEKALKHKLRNGLYTYDDMITDLYNTLMQSSRSDLASILRKKYSYALIDEFQDTDMLQWSIFKFIFLNSKNKLFVIGDPKQAIYSFRGADVYAYYSAKVDMLENHNAVFYCLNENWRSCPQLITFFNNLFIGKTWFSDPNIAYEPNSFPKNKSIEHHNLNNNIVAVNLSELSPSGALAAFSAFIASEIKKILKFEKGTSLDDFAILIGKWKEAIIIENELKAADIPYIFYKKEGLFQTDEAYEIDIVLSSLSDQNNQDLKRKAMITNFFRVPPASLDSDQSSLNAAKLYIRLTELCEINDWPNLAIELMESAGLKSEDSIRESYISSERYKAILRLLFKQAKADNMTILSLRDDLKRLIATSFNDPDISLSSNTSDGNVRIMTVHAAKGLQFRIIFLASGFSLPKKNKFSTYHMNSKKIFDLCDTNNTNEFFKSEVDHETERLFYVAATRAIDRMYLPYYTPTKNGTRFAGILGTKLNSVISGIASSIDHINITEYDFTFGNMQRNDTPQNLHVPLILPQPLFNDEKTSFFDRRTLINSFTDITANLDEHSDYQRHLEFQPKNKYTLDDNSLWSNIPFGIETGLLFHEILEQIDFSIFSENKFNSETIESQITDLIEKCINRHYTLCATLDQLRGSIIKILYSILSTPIDSAGFKLSDINNKDRLNEVEFYFKTDESTSRKPTGIRQWASSFMHGFIDMIFIKDKRYFFADWKTNYIEEGYLADSIRKNMIESNYTIQFSIYTQAVILWLKRAVQGFSYHEHFGGIYYFYLRGMDPNHPGQGIFFHRPDTESDLYNKLF
jgi:exodeoxyribonuclease V beta subunit